MVNITLSIPDELKKEMEKFPEMNWSEIARAAIRKRIEILGFFKEFTKDSALTEEDAIKLGKQVNKALAKRYSEIRKSK